jgi:hypothetical protein
VNLAARGYLEQKFRIILRDGSEYSCLKKYDYEQVKEIEKVVNIEQIAKNFLESRQQAI